MGRILPLLQEYDRHETCLHTKCLNVAAWHVSPCMHMTAGLKLTPVMHLADAKWGQAYLTRDFFHRLGETMVRHQRACPARLAVSATLQVVLLEHAHAQGDRVVLATAADADGTPVAGALNLRGSHALFGRNWGCSREVKHLHFELCYYQALDAAIQLKLPRVEAGAQVWPGMVSACNPALTWCAVSRALLTLLLGRQGEHKIQRGYGLRSPP